jgi:photosystem II protein
MASAGFRPVQVAKPSTTRAFQARMPGLAKSRPSLIVRAQDKDQNKPYPAGGPGFKTDITQPAFTRRREHLIGRLAALGFSFGLVGELLTGRGPISQLHMETGLPFGVLYAVIIGLVGYSAYGALRPGSPTYSRANQEDVAKRDDSISPADDPRKFLVANEAVVGRLAMLGFAGASLLEYLWQGEAPLVHLNLITPGVSLFEAPWWFIATVGLFFANGIGVFSRAVDRKGDNDAY